MGIVVVGGSGFIGTRLCSLFKLEGLDFKIVDKVVSQSFPDQTILGDVRYVDNLDSCILDNSILINLAAEHRDDVRPVSLYYEVNVLGAKNLCLIATRKNVNTIIFTSSVAIYGPTPFDTDEFGIAAPLNDYGRTKYEAENVYRAWQLEDPLNRTLVIIRPTVVFGEQNRGNVYNLFRQISSGRFMMIGDGLNRKSLAYVGNLVAFIHHTLTFKPTIHIYNYIDKPDLTMNELIHIVSNVLAKSSTIKYRLPYKLALSIGIVFDLIAKITRKRLPISLIRIKKFCANSMYSSSASITDFTPPFLLRDAIESTVKHEFLKVNKNN